MSRKQTYKETISARIDKGLFDVINVICASTNVTKTYIVENGIIEFLIKTSKDLKYNGIDLKNFCEVKRLENLRSLEIEVKNEIKSRHFYLNRVRKDIMEYIINEMSLIDILELLEQHKKVATHYKDNTIIKQIDKYIEDAKFNNFSRFKKEVHKKHKIRLSSIDIKEINRAIQ